MCGIVGAISKNRNILPILITWLKNLEYRGYDSTGVAYLKNNKINIVKTSGKVSKLENKLNKSDESNIDIAYTRWATYGKQLILILILIELNILLLFIII